MFKAGRYNYHTLITLQEIPGQASQLSYASLTRLSSRVACESLACETNVIPPERHLCASLATPKKVITVNDYSRFSQNEGFVTTTV